MAIKKSFADDSVIQGDSRELGFLYLKRRLYSSRKPFIWAVCLLAVLITVTVVNILSVEYEQETPIGSPSLTFSCPPRKNIVFLKTHKCAGSAIQNVLLRYGDEHNLTFALPAKFNYFGHPGFFMRTQVLDYPKRTFNILVHHTRYNRPEMDLVMSPGTVYVTVVRRPIDLLESLYSFYHVETVLKMNIETMSLNQTYMEKRLGEERIQGRLGLNQMSFDLGLNASQFHNKTAIQDLVHRLDSDFDLVMVYERLPESLVLLSDLLCWSLEDVVVFEVNVRKEKLRMKLSQNTVQRLKDVSAPDIALYEHFSRKFQAKVEAYGLERMEIQLAKLEQVTEALHGRCVARRLSDSEEDTSVYNFQAVKQFKMKRNDTKCQNVFRSELGYANWLREKQRS